MKSVLYWSPRNSRLAHKGKNIDLGNITYRSASQFAAAKNLQFVLVGKKEVTN